MIDWKVGTLKSAQMVASNVKSLIFEVPDFDVHKAGQHVNIKLNSSDGYSAERDYSIANAPEQSGTIELGVQLLEDGEVSPYLYQMQAGDKIEIRGPIGGHFVWDISMAGPLILIGGGSGMVPLMSMLRHHINNLEKDQFRKIIFLISARTEDKILYREELLNLENQDKNLKLVTALTSETPENWTGYTRRIDKEMLKEVLDQLKDQLPMIYVCGPTPFVESVANNLVHLGFNSHEIKTERFGGA